MQRSRVYSFTDPESEEHAASEIIRTRASVKYKDFFIVTPPKIHNLALNTL